MSTGNSWEGIKQVRATLLGARHVPERLCGGRVYLGRYIKCSTFTFFYPSNCEFKHFMMLNKQWLNYSKVGGGTLHFFTTFPSLPFLNPLAFFSLPSVSPP